MSGGGVLAARGRGEVFAAIVVKYFSRWIVRKGTRKKRTQTTEAVLIQRKCSTHKSKEHLL